MNNNNIPADDWGKHYESLVADTTKSEEIHQELLAKLYSNPETAKLMDILGVSG